MTIAAASPFPPLTDVVITTVKPLHKTAHVESIDPIYTDLSFQDMYVPSLFAYRLENKSRDSHFQLISRIKESLQKVLVPCYSYAGRWFVDEINERKMVCNDEGVPFIEAYVDHDMDAVVHPSLEFQEIPELQGYAPLGMDFTQLKQQVPVEGLPPVFVQVTRFKCGGLVLAVTFSHMHTDASGFFHFIGAWSDFCRNDETEVKMDHNRALAEVPAIRNLLLMMRNGKGVKGDEPPPAPMPRWVMKIFEVSSSAIKSMKQEAKDSNIGPGFVSTQDCIAAHMWRSLVRLPSSMLDGQEVTITIVVEGRSKFFDPPLSKFLCGNVIAPIWPNHIPAKELAEMPLASTACKIREQLETTPREEWRSLERFSELMKVFQSYKTWSITSWFKLPMYEMDFGFGKPIFATRVSNLWSYGRPPGIVGSTSIGPPIPGSSGSVATACVFSTPDMLQALENDPLFLYLFLARGNEA